MNPENGNTETYRFEILRYDAAKDELPRFQIYEAVVEKNLSVLEVLLKIQDEQDPSLAFRYACRGAICGSCAMSINGSLNLACRVQLKNLFTTRVVLEPLPNFAIIKDLVLDMELFWEKYERVRPWLHAQISASQETLMSEEERRRIDQYVNCILCGLCCGACPVLGSNEDFTGPAALAKLYRFVVDSRENRGGETLEQENRHAGMWGCHTITKCIEVCPKDVRPTDGIEGIRRKFLVHKFKGLLRRKRHEA